VGGSVQIDRLAEDGDMIQLEENISISVIHTPGHSSGSISLFLDSEGILFSGDCILLPGHLPIYDDALEAVASVRKLRQLSNINVLLSSWDDPCSGDTVLEKIDQSIFYFERIHEIIKGIENARSLEPTQLCKQVIDILELPAGAVNPLTVRSFLSNVNAL
jgi:glyoxylase-like metal-dependent hydrolase (beta-lactamase superfamily II)